MNQLVLLKLAKLERQCVRRRLRYQSLKLTEAFFSIDEVPQNDGLILSSDKAHGGFNCAIEPFAGFHKNTPCAHYQKG